MRLLCLDLGTNTGWAILESGVVSSGVEKFAVDRFSGGGMRFLRFKRWLTEMKGDGTLDGTFDAIYYEEVRRHIGVDAAHCYGAFWGHLTAWCEHHGIPYQGVPVGTIKKSFTGKGNADKPKMIEEAKRRGFHVVDDNEADAVALLQYVLHDVLKVAA